MKKIVMAIVFAFFYSALFLPSATSVTNCNQVKAQVLSLEKLVESEFQYFYRFNGQRISGVLEGKYISSTTNKYLQKLGKVEYNNSHCFTRSQNDQIIQSRYWLRESIVTVMTYTSGYGSECNGNPTKSSFILNGKRIIRCDVSPYYVIAMSPDAFKGSIYRF